MKLIIQIPCYNEEETLELAYNALHHILCPQWKSNQLDKQKYPKKQLHTLFYLIWMTKVRKKTFS